jgi:3-methyladenine DNA glycosylase AlkC
MLKKTIKPPKKTLDDLMKDKSVITGKEVVHNLKELEKRQKEFEESVEDELRNRRVKR